MPERIARKRLNEVRQASGLPPWTEVAAPYQAPLSDISNLLPQWTDRKEADRVAISRPPPQQTFHLIGAEYPISESELADLKAIMMTEDAPTAIGFPPRTIGAVRWADMNVGM